MIPELVEANNLSSLRFRRVGREFFWIGLGQTGAVLGGIIGVRLLTQALSPEKYGELALGLTMVGLVTQLTMGPLGQGILRFFGSAQEGGEVRAYLNGIWNLLGRACFLVTCLAILILIGLWGLGQAAWIGLISIAFVFALVSGLSLALNSIQNAARQRAIVAWHQVLGQWLRPLLAVGLIIALGTFSSLAMMGYVLAAMIVLISQYLFFRHTFSGEFSSKFPNHFLNAKEWAGRIQKYAWPFLTWGLFLWAQQSSDRWALQTFNQTRDVGYYQVLAQLGYMPIILVTGLAVQFLQPILFNLAGDASDPMRLRRARKLNYYAIIAFLILTLFGTGLAFLFHKWFFVLLVAPEYWGVSSLLTWMVLSGGLFASGEMAALLLMTGADTRFLIVPKIATAILGIILNFGGAYWLGLVGVVFASLCFSLVYLIWVLILSSQTRNLEVVSIT
jgi:O-antigen/teichoic acid export membrane protein